MKTTSKEVPRSDLRRKCGGGRRRTDLHRLEELSDSVGVDDPRDGSDREDLAGLREERRACGKKPSCSTRKQHAHPYLARQLSIEYHRQSTEGYPAMVDLSMGVRVIRNRMVT